jgi:hypothetical protein
MNAIDSVDNMSGKGAGSLANSVVFASETSAIVAAMLFAATAEAERRAPPARTHHET